MTVQPIQPAPTADIRPIVIACDNSFAHAYTSIPAMLSEKDIGGKNPGGLEFFDHEGRRLSPVFSQTWELEGLAQSLDEPDPELVQCRLQAVVQHVADYIRRHPEVVEDFGLTAEQAIESLPQLGAESLAADAAQFPGNETPTDGLVLMHRNGWFHNSLHAAGFNH